MRGFRIYDTARSLKALGWFRTICFIRDSGGNQADQKNTMNKFVCLQPFIVSTERRHPTVCPQVREKPALTCILLYSVPSDPFQSYPTHSSTARLLLPSQVLHPRTPQQSSYFFIRMRSKAQAEPVCASTVRNQSMPPERVGHLQTK